MLLTFTESDVPPSFRDILIDGVRQISAEKYTETHYHYFNQSNCQFEKIILP